MNAIKLINERILFVNRRIAVFLCSHVDELVSNPSVEKLDEIQDLLLVGTREVAETLGRVTDSQRNKRRRDLILNRKKRKPDISQHIGAHNQLLRERVEHLKTRQNVFFQCGDALAWIVLAGRRVMVESLFQEDVTPQVPVGWGGEGNAEVRRQINAEGDWYALQADLSRCLGTGDLIVVPVDGNWYKPSIIEVKTSGDEASGFELKLIGLNPDDSNDSRLIACLDKGLQFEVVRDLEINRRGVRQLERIEESARRIYRYLQQRPEDIGTARGHWESVRRVIEAALSHRISYDLAEPGLCFCAYRSDMPTSEVEKKIAEAESLTRDSDMDDHRNYTVRSSDLLGDRRASQFIPPMMLWKLPLHQRAALLTGEVVVSSIVRYETWVRAFRNQGIAVHRQGDGWALVSGASVVQVSPSEVRSLVIGAGLGYISPEWFGAAVAESFCEQ